jgi:hypothetical protein
MRPVLRPGLQILRRDVRTLQFGHDWPGLAAAPDSPALQAVLAELDGYRDLDGVLLAAETHPGVTRDGCRAALALLVERGVVVERTRAEVSVQQERQAASWWLLAGPDGAGDAIGAERRAVRVWVEDWGVSPATIAADARPLVRRAGLGVADSRSAADLVVAAVDDIPDRSMSDDLMRAGKPHVWASLRDLVGVVGPLVLPGETACLRCVDAARTELDPTWPTVVSAGAARPRATSPCDPLVATVVAAWAVQEAAIWASGLVPTAYGAVIDIPLGLGPVTQRLHSVHPQCGCGWHTRHDTIGA